MTAQISPSDLEPSGWRSRPPPAGTAASVSAKQQHTAATQELLDLAHEHGIHVVDATRCTGVPELDALLVAKGADFFEKVFKREKCRHWEDRTDLWRPGLCMASGSMVGVSTPLWVVKDVATPPSAADVASPDDAKTASVAKEIAAAAPSPVEIEVRQCMTESGAEAHAKLLAAENKGRTYKVELALDSVAAINLIGTLSIGCVFTGKEFLPKGIEQHKPEDDEDPFEHECMQSLLARQKALEQFKSVRREDVEATSTRVTEATSAIAAAARQHGAFVVSEFFVMHPMAQRRLSI